MNDTDFVSLSIPQEYYFEGYRVLSLPLLENAARDFSSKAVINPKVAMTYAWIHYQKYLNEYLRESLSIFFFESVLFGVIDSLRSAGFPRACYELWDMVISANEPKTLSQ